MRKHGELSNGQLFKLIKNQSINLAGNKRLKIYGTLKCKSGKRMKKSNRVFFKNKSEAKLVGFRPCGHCMKNDYLKWSVIF